MESSSDFGVGSSCLLQLPSEKMIEIQLTAVRDVWYSRLKSNKCQVNLEFIQLRRMDSV